MRREDAIKKLSKILGKNFGYRVDQRAPDHDGREEARAAASELFPKRKALEEAVQARRNAILQADAEYQRLKAEHAEVSKRCSELTGTANRYRFTVGTTVGNLFFSVKAQGDSWEEIIAKLKEKVVA